MADINSIISLHEVFQIFEENCKNSQIYHSNYIYKFSYTVSHTIFEKWSTNRISIVLKLIVIFCSIYLWCTPNELVSHSESLLKVGTNIYHLIHLGKRDTLLLNIPMLIWPVSIMTYDIPIKRKKYRIPPCIHKAWHFIPHRHEVEGRD